jgi:hypothetical protein
MLLRVRTPRALFAQEAAARAEIESLMQYAQQHHVPPLSPSRASCGHFSGAAGGWKMCREDKRYAMRGRLLVRAPLQPTVIALDRFRRQNCGGSSGSSSNDTLKSVDGLI